MNYFVKLELANFTDMKFFHDKGVVLRKHSVREKDEVVIFLTKSGGKMAFVAYGSRDPKSRKAGVLELFNTVAFEARDSKAKMPTIQQAKLIKSRGLGIVAEDDSLAEFYRASEILKFTAEHLQDDQIVQNVYQHLNTALDLVSFSSMAVIFKIRLLDDLGYLPDWKSCCVCHEELVLQDQLCWSDENRGFVHANCKFVGDKVVSGDLLKVMNYYQKENIEKGVKVNVDDFILNEISSLFDGLEIH